MGQSSEHHDRRLRRQPSMLPHPHGQHEHYLVNELPRVLISIIQGSKLFSTVVGDMGVLRRQIKIKARHQNSPSQAHASACLERAH
jgi:hypothetical protein